MEEAIDRALCVFIAVAAILVLSLAIGRVNDRVTMLQSDLLVTPAQLDSALVEAAYLLLSERDSVIRECAKKLGPLNPECR